MRTTRRSLRLALLAGVLALGGGAAGAAQAGPDAKAKANEPTNAEIRAAIERGVDFLVEKQTKRGSWGTPAPTLFLDIMSPAPGSHYAYEAASSALALSALVENGAGRPGVEETVRRGTDWLLAHHGVRRVRPRVLYNNWAHAYALETFARLLAREKDPKRRRQLHEAAGEAIGLLERFQFVDGGWGYYDFSVGARTPAHGQATSFTTASVLYALGLALAQGIAVPERLIPDAVQLLRVCRLPGNAYAYGFRRRFVTPRSLNKPEGSAARTPACLVSLLSVNENVTEKRLVRALDDLEKNGHFLRIARKYPRPHESWFANSGYFCFYGYYYASLLLQHVPKDKRDFHARRMAYHLLPLQEPDGSWWDYQLFRFHKYYGTGYVVMTLGNCLRALEEKDTAAE